MRRFYNICVGRNEKQECIVCDLEKKAYLCLLRTQYLKRYETKVLPALFFDVVNMFFIVG